MVRAAWLALAVPGLWQVGLLLYAVLGRFSYGYDLEWMEGGMLDHALRLAQGQGIYVQPSIEFIPYLYTPLYPAVLALAGSVVGISYQLGRAISIMAMLGVMACMVIALVRGVDARDRTVALTGSALALGLFAATYPWLDGWYDLVRGDTLFLVMIMSGFLLLGRARSPDAAYRSAWRPRPAVMGAALLLGLSFFCKQTGVLYVAAGGALLLVRNWRQVPVYVALTGVIGLGGTWLVDRLSHGWFWTYIYEIHQAHDFNMDRFYKSFSNILWKFPAMTVVIGLALAAVGLTALARRPLSRSAGVLLTWSFLFAVSCVVGAVGWGTQWAHFNAYLPAMTTGALAAGAGLGALGGVARAFFERADEPLSSLPGEPLSAPDAGLAWRRALAMHAAGWAVALVLCIELYASRWNPGRFIPTERDRKAGDALIAYLRELRQHGELYMPYHPWYARLAGQDTAYAHRMGLLDVTYGNRERVAGLREALSQSRFAAIILDNRPVGSEFPGLRQGYRLDDHLPADLAPRLYTGARIVPQAVWRPIADELPRGATVLFDFESRLSGQWRKEGKAWGQGPVSGPLSGQGQVLGYRGRSFMDSMHGGDASTGTLTSPPVRLTGKRLTFRLSGGSDPRTLRVELRVAGQVMRRASNQVSTERMSEVVWDVAELSGQEAEIVLIDDATGAWGHLNVDHFLMWEE